MLWLEAKHLATGTHFSNMIACSHSCGKSFVGGLVIRSLRAISVVLVCVVCASVQTARAQQYPTNLYQEMRWRMIGPFRGGRTRAVAGVPSQPNVFYIGAVD